MPLSSSSVSERMVYPRLSAGYNDKKQRTARAEDEREIENAFIVFDIGGKNYLTFYEFRSAIKGLGFDLPIDDFKLVFHELGVDLPDGRGIKKPDFISFGRRLFEYQPLKDKLTTIFNLIDTTKRGSLGLSDLRQAARFAELEFNDQELQGMIDAFDMKGTGAISFKDFCDLCDEDLFEEVNLSSVV